MLAGPLLVTDRLILRPPIAADFDAFASMYAEEETMRFLGGAVSRSVAWRHFTCIAGAWLINGHSMFSVIERSSGDWVGRIGPWTPDGWPIPEIAYGLSEKFAGQGYAHEAAVAAIDFAVDFLKWEEIAHTINPENAASLALAQKLGASNKGQVHLPEPLADSRVDCWSQTAAEWKARKKA